MSATATSTNALSASTRYSIPHGGAQLPSAYENAPSVATRVASSAAMTRQA
ncbi:MAG: hypothetical protein U1F45_17695 [Burkholderiales bacterium]